MKIGIQISSLKPMLQTLGDLRTTCEKLAALGCDTVQLQWLNRELPAKEVAGILAETGITSVSVQDYYTEIRGNLEYYVNLNRETRGLWLCPSRILDSCKTPEGLDLYAAELKQLSALLRDNYGQKLCFHPVSADFFAIEGMDAVGALLEKLPDMELCLDLYHLNRYTDDMPGYIRRYAGRIPMVHFKDADARGRLVPAGQGEVKWEGVAAACLDAGVAYAFAEQESWDRDPFCCLKEAMDWVVGELANAK